MDLLALGGERFVSLTTFRRSGTPVATPVWVARDGGALVVTTPAGSGKVKRLRRDPRVELRPCDRRGRVRPGAPTATGTAEIVAGAGGDAPTALIRRKYGIEYRVVMLLERLLVRGPRERVVLRVTPRP
ncbi:PPOX class F420-dependent oxidoreductase [Catellatospora sp. NPDC049609]|uniref:PPOX class F420-dependent oxidoreductase n=1 Tax=Catellatospora sp. NPDC049609 TaxID=3155505 RepID=UPI003430F669